MGAYTFLCRRVSPMQAERMMLDGRVYSSEELFRLGIVDHLVPKGEGESAVREVIKRQQRIGNARLAMDRVRDLARPVSLDQLLSVTGVWVDAAMQLSEKALGTMERLVRAQKKRFVDNVAAPMVQEQRLTG
jgi:DSF synthase